MCYLCGHIPDHRRVKKGGKEARLRILAIFSFQQRQRVGKKNVPNWGAEFLGFGGDRIERTCCAGKMCSPGSKELMNIPLPVARQRKAVFG